MADGGAGLTDRTADTPGIPAPHAPAPFAPGPDTLRAFRDALGAFPTGVTIVTCTGSDGGPLGITANSFSSVSLDPPLVLWSPAKASSRYAQFLAAQSFAIHVLAADQAEMCRRFTRAGTDFDGLPDLRNDEGVPILPDVVVRFDCRLEAAHDAGDHTILVGRVLRVVHRPAAALVFVAGRFAATTV